MKVKKFLKGFMAAALAVTMAVTPVSAVKAAPETMPDGMIFDADYYAQTYPDVANAVGTDRDSLYNHYVTFGKAEGRLACAPTTVQTDQNPIVPSIQSKDPLTAKTTPTQALVYAGLLPDFMLTDSRPRHGGSSYVYDAYGNLISNGFLDYCICDEEGRIVGHYDVLWSRYFNCVYNEQGQLIQLKHDMREVQFYYDDRGRLIKLSELIKGSDKVSVTEINYNEQERKISVDSRNYSRDYIFDEQGRLIRYLFCDSASDWSDTFYDYQYEYDSSGRLVEVTMICTCVDRRSGEIYKPKSGEENYEYIYN